jgi:acyl CoA:acetate/3-ketoacid CoA transferase alpha subunit
LTADVALIKALKAARLVIVEVDAIVEAGELSVEEIVTPHLYVDYIVLKGEASDE